jgi:phosphonopyruvate decarboxylase
MISTARWAGLLADAGYTMAAGVPCSSLSPLQNHFQATQQFTYIAAPNEGQAVAVASGAVMAGQRAIVVMQNSGLGNAINPLTSLVETFRLPLILVTSWRGQPGQPDEPQHHRMGLSTHALLDAIKIRHVTLDARDNAATQQLREAIGHAERDRCCVAIVVPDGVFEATAAVSDEPALFSPGFYEDLVDGGHRLSRTAVLARLLAWTGPGAIRLATTGKTGREQFAR